MLFLITALGCEAEPLIGHFNLRKKQTPWNFALYENGSIGLIVSGIGKNKIATAIGLLNGLFPLPFHAWLNVGIAGHQNFELGQGYFIHKITDHALQQNYYPVFTKPVPCKTASLVTVEKPEKNFESDALYDMEGSAFFSACSQFSTTELIHAYKVVSDNAENSYEKLNKSTVSKLIGQKLKDIDAMVGNLKEVSSLLERIHYFQEQDLSSFFFRWHFTETQKHFLKRLLQKWRAIESHKPIWDANLDKFTKTASVLEYLQKKINATVLNF